MNYKMIINIIGKIMILLALLMILPMIVSIIYSEGILWAVLGQKNDLPSVTKSGVSPILSSERREKNLYRKTVGARERMWHIQSKLGPSLPV